VDLTRRAHVQRRMTYADVIMAREHREEERRPDAEARQVSVDLTRSVGFFALRNLIGNDRTPRCSASGETE
jgi:hypothetical protein